MKDTYKHKGLRKRLIETLIEKGIEDEKVLQAMLHVPRHLFFEKEFEDFSYEDKAYPIADGQTISQPYTVAAQTSLLETRPGIKVLEIGTGSGYQAAVLAQLKVKLYSVERKKSLHQKAQHLLNELGYQVNLLYGDGSQGWFNHAPYDRILVTAGAPEIPQAFVDQLKPGGLLIIPVGDQENQRMIRAIKQADSSLIMEDHGAFRFVPLIGNDGW
ncbi:MAG: protein-L-isoaspartate(D-aspartate) O-methyltransferase [Bacteroidetes bacterium]|nr:protein-L-isoaspartate(D-aspartate) O-methyltransferase [Bacteroidota bacterium]